MIRLSSFMKLRRLIALASGGVSRRVTAFAGATGGNVAILFAIAAVPLVGAAGLALDSGRAYLVEHRLSAALDSASLAAVQVNFLDRAATDARAFFDANFPDGYMQSSIASFDFRTSEIDETIEISVTADVPTTLMRVLGKDNIRITRAATAQRLTRGLELALVMDATSSMTRDDRVGSMKASAKELVEILAGQDEAMRNTWVSIVPYAAMVNIGPAHSDWLVDSSEVTPGDSEYRYGDGGWQGCVKARRDARTNSDRRDETDDDPFANTGSNRFEPFYFPSARDNLYTTRDNRTIRDAPSYKGRGSGPNIGCVTEITPLTNDRSRIIEEIDSIELAYRGGTMSNLGLVWGWRTISPKWRGLWPDLNDAWEGSNGPKSLPLDYEEPLMSKAIVLLTDGENKFYDWPDRYYGYFYINHDWSYGPSGSDETAYGRLYDALSYPDRYNPQTWLNDKLTSVCAAVRDAGIEVFTITFGSEIDNDTKSVFESCATEPAQYFHAPTGGDLRSVFRTVGRTLSHTRLVR